MRHPFANALVLTGPCSAGPPWPSAGGSGKHLVPVANRPILSHTVDGLRRLGVRTATVAVCPGERPEIRAAGELDDLTGLSLRYAECERADGVGLVLAATRDGLGDEPVLVVHGDTLLDAAAAEHLRAFPAGGLDVLALDVQTPPWGATSTLAAAWLLSPRAVGLLAEAATSVTDAAAVVSERGGRVASVEVDGCLPCHGGQDALLEANRWLLTRMVAPREPRRHPGCELMGPVSIDPTATLTSTVVRGPAIIGPGAHLTDAYVGPYTSIGADVVIDGAEIEYSIVLAGAELGSIGTRLESSVIGQGARVLRRFHVPNALRLSVGTGAEVALA